MTEPIRPLILNEAEIAAAAPSLTEIVEIIADTYRIDGEGGVEVPSKIGVHPDHRNSFCHAMPAWVPSRQALGMKWVSYFPGNTQRNLPDSTGIILLNHPERGLPVAILEGMWITYARTTASAVVMAQTLAPRPPKTLALIGCGGLGHWMARMAAAALPSVDKVFVASRSETSRRSFCEEMAGITGLEMVPVSDPRDAVAPADLIVSSIPPPDAAFIEADWLKPGALSVPLDYFHCYTPGAAAAMAAIFTDDRSKIRPQLANLLGPEWASDMELRDFAPVAAGRAAAAIGVERPVMAIPTGIASTDMTLAWEIYRRASAAGAGTIVPLTGG